MTLLWIIIFILVYGVLAYNHASLSIFTISYSLLFIFLIHQHGFTIANTVTLLIFAAFFSLLIFSPLRRRLITHKLFKFYKKLMPSMSSTEREAISAGTVGWEGELFRGNPDWSRLLNTPTTTLSEEEQAFLDGPVNELCSMIDDWDITHNRNDMPPQVWQFMKDQGFFGLIIPKEYGGKGFSAYAHSEIILRVGSVSVTAGVTVTVPNSLGPAELLLHYGTKEQKQYYLPRLAKGIDIPCFALTSPTAGSDAGSLTDYGIICKQDFEGQLTLGIRLNFNKRYITLAPSATVIGLAFKLHDPDHLLSQTTDLGITCALIPRKTPGIQIGRRHFPLNSAFLNGPVIGHDVFIPLDWIIGGPSQAGQGWRMLMECLAAGRAISLPSSSIAGCKVATFATSAYAKIRKQFNQSIGQFEGIQEPLARIAAFTYLADAARIFTTMAIDQGEKPAIASAIIKYHATEISRKIACDAMDIHGGKGICLGPNNYLGRGFQATPIAITVEGANILTRNMIIFGQGVMRCHPYLLAELNAANLTNVNEAEKSFDSAVMKHIAYAFSNIIRSFVLGITGSLFVSAPQSPLKRYYQQATRFSSAFAFMADACIAIYGSNLKRRESTSARLGDIHSYLYLLTTVLKRYHNDENHDDLPIAKYASLYCLFEIQEKFSELLRNIPNRFLAVLMRIIIFPLGERFTKPRDEITRKVANLLLENPSVRYRLTEGMYLPAVGDHLMLQIDLAMKKSREADPIEKIILNGVKEGKIKGYTREEQLESAKATGMITNEQYKIYKDAYEACMKVIAVDDFDPEELKRNVSEHYNERLQSKAV